MKFTEEDSKKFNVEKEMEIANNDLTFAHSQSVTVTLWSTLTVRAHDIHRSHCVELFNKRVHINWLSVSHSQISSFDRTYFVWKQSCNWN